MLLKAKANLEAELDKAKKNPILDIATLQQKLSDEAGWKELCEAELEGLQKAL